MKAKLVRKVKRADNIYSYFFSVDRLPKYTAGQYIELTIKHDNPDDRGQRHWFTLSGPPRDQHLVITTRYVAGSSSSFKVAMNGLGPDDEVDISDPLGDFVLPIDQSQPLLFVAGGIGITPFLSILSHLSASSEKRNINLIYAVKSKSESINLDSYKGLLNNYREIGSAPGDELTADLIIEEANKLGTPLIYISGPEKMVEVLAKAIIDSGVESRWVVGDYFPGYDT